MTSTGHAFLDLECALLWACEGHQSGKREKPTPDKEEPDDECVVEEPSEANIEFERTEVIDDATLQKILRLSPWERMLHQNADTSPSS